MSKRVALLFGLNYEGTNNALRGCVNDVNNMSKWLEDQGFECEKCCDYTTTCASYMIRKISELAHRTHIEKIETVWIHYSGHGTYIKDKSGDELDGHDECLCPSDLVLIPDDYLQDLFKTFSRKTKLIFMADCCHSGTISDLPFSWDYENLTYTRDNEEKFKNKIVTISGCKDDQTSADAYLPDSISGQHQFSGAMTTHLLQLLYKGTFDLFSICKELNILLKANGFEQRPRLSSSYNIRKDAQIF